MTALSSTETVTDDAADNELRAVVPAVISNVWISAVRPLRVIVTLTAVIGIAVLDC